MPPISYKWTRFWAPRTGRLYLDFDGYLVDPEGGDGKLRNPDVVRLERLTDSLCLVLLGEPGAGKTRALHDEREAEERRIAAAGGTSLWVDLHDVTNPTELWTAIFESPAWKGPNGTLHLFLDSVDESPMGAGAIAHHLLKGIVAHPRDQLRLRLVCRTAEWPSGFESALKERWADVVIYEIAPLRRMDVESAARSHGLDPSAALDAIAEREAVPFALRPVTLGFLLTRLAGGKPLPTSRLELYGEQCRSLCEERNERRTRSPVSPDECVVLAERIAASLLFAGKACVFVDPDRGDLLDGDLPLRELVGDRETVEGEFFITASEPALRAALATGLFSSRGPGRLSFAHHTFAEFLAARYVWRRRLPLAQIRGLMVHPGFCRVVPPLHGVAAWLASNKDFFDLVVQRDPQVLLAADAAIFDAERKGRIVESLLARHDRREQLPGDPFVREPFEKLAHAGLADVLRPYVHGSQHDPDARCIAIRIAAACKETSLCDALIAVVEDRDDQIDVRGWAADALKALAGEELLARFKPFAIATDPSDRKDELKGSVLHALWPKYLSISEVLTALTPARARNYHGSYLSFVRYDVVKHASDEDLLALLAWTNAQPSRHVVGEPTRALLDAVLEKAWEKLDRPAFMDTYARAVLTRMGLDDLPIHRRLLSEVHWARDHEKRRGVLRCLLENVGSASSADHRRYRELLGPGDLEWLVALLDEDLDAMVRSFLVALFSWVLRFEAPFELVDTLALVCGRHADLAAALRPLFEATPLDAPAAQEARDHLRAMMTERRRTTLLEGERIGALLDRFEQGDTAAYWQADLQLGVDADGREDFSDDPSDATKLAGWLILADTARKRVVSAASEYLRMGKCSPGTWVGKSYPEEPALAGYRALRLVMKEDPATFDSLTPATWREWAPIVAAFPGLSEADARKHGLLVHAYRHAPELVLETVIAGLIDDDVHHRHPHGHRCLDVVWDARIETRLLELVREPLHPTSLRELLETLLGHRSQGAVAAASAFLRLPVPRDELERSCMSGACEALMRHALAAAWPRLYHVLIAERVFARDLVGHFAVHAEMRSGKLTESLSEGDCGRFLAWLEDELPRFQDRAKLEAPLARTCARVTELRGAVVRELAARGTIQALELLRTADTTNPGRPYLRRAVLEAEQQALSRMWTRVSPADLRSLARDASKRLVSDEDGLLEVVVDSLRRFDAKLRDHSQMVRFLWDKQLNNGTFAPVDENVFSDFVRDHLQTDIVMSGIVLNREVQLRPSVARNSGERTDIHIDAISRNPVRQGYGQLTVIIETKGAWNRDLFTAMATQLRGRYLTGTPARRGVYLVGWFASALWTDDDQRKRRVPCEAMQSVASRLAEQAVGCSTSGIRIEAVVVNATLPGEASAVGRKGRVPSRARKHPAKATLAKPRGRGE